MIKTLSWKFEVTTRLIAYCYIQPPAPHLFLNMRIYARQTYMETLLNYSQYLALPKKKSMYVTAFLFY